MNNNTISRTITENEEYYIIRNVEHNNSLFDVGIRKVIFKSKEPKQLNQREKMFTGYTVKQWNEKMSKFGCEIFDAPIMLSLWKSILERQTNGSEQYRNMIISSLRNDIASEKGILTGTSISYGHVTDILIQKYVKRKQEPLNMNYKSGVLSKCAYIIDDGVKSTLECIMKDDASSIDSITKAMFNNEQIYLSVSSHEKTRHYPEYNSPLRLKINNKVLVFDLTCTVPGNDFTTKAVRGYKIM